jgi:hypothetical protein
MLATRTLVILSSYLVLSACVRFSLNRPCDDDTDCPEPLVCAFRSDPSNTLCLLPCERNADCEEALGDWCFMCGNEDGLLLPGSDETLDNGFCAAGCN